MTKSLSQDVAKVIRGILAERQITVQEFAASMGEPNSSVARWIKGGGSFKTDKLDAMAEALNMDPSELVLLALSKRGLSGATEAERADLQRSIERVRPATGSRRIRREDVG